MLTLDAQTPHETPMRRPSSSNRFSVLEESESNGEPAEERQDEPIQHQREPAREIHHDEPRETSSILMLSDSIFRGILQNRFAPGRYINKQVIKGGCNEMLKHLNIMSSEAGAKFEYVILHTGTNDVGVTPTERICEGIEQIIKQCQRLWPESKIILSGLTYNLREHAKNDIIDVINSASERMCQNLPNVHYVDNRRVCLNNNGEIEPNVFYDDIHLNNQVGVRKLVSNMKSQIPGLRRVAGRRQTWKDRRGEQVKPRTTYYGPETVPQSRPQNPQHRMYPQHQHQGAQGIHQQNGQMFQQNGQYNNINTELNNLENALRVITECVRRVYHTR